MLKILCLSLLLWGSNSHGRIIAPHLQDEVIDVLELLPENFVSDDQIHIESAQLQNDHLFTEDLCNLNSSVQFGITTTRRGKSIITISKRLIELARTVRKEFPCLHGSFAKVLKGTIIHELTHVKDNKERISLDPDFQRIVGVKRVSSSSRKKLMNHNVFTSPDAYEFENLEEALAVNVEYLILDPEFQCRKPAIANFLSQSLGVKLKSACQMNYKILTQSSYLEDNYLHAASINPSRVYQVHYLFAGKGKGIMSRWGHAMFRLVVCAPHRKVPGPECLKDVSHHLALSYRAHITDMSISYKKGLTGEYPSQLFIMRFHEVQQEYTKFELRELYSVPIKLSFAQKKEFLDLTLERYWTYQGKYYFLGNNCGTETQKHLAQALSHEQGDLIHSITPSRMYKDIIKSTNNLTEEKIEGTRREELVSKGILIESLSRDLEATFQELRVAGFFDEKNFKKFLRRTSAAKRLDVYKEVFSNGYRPKDFKRILMRLIYLERYLVSRFVTNLPKKAIEKMNKDEAIKSAVLKMGEGVKTLGLQPWQVIKGRYGVPTGAEYDLQFNPFVRKRSQEMKISIDQQMKSIQTILGQKYFSRELSEMGNFQEIKKLTNELILEANKQEIL